MQTNYFYGRLMVQASSLGKYTAELDLTNSFVQQTLL